MAIEYSVPVVSAGMTFSHSTDPSTCPMSLTEDIDIEERDKSVPDLAVTVVVLSFHICQSMTGPHGDKKEH